MQEIIKQAAPFILKMSAVVVLCIFLFAAIFGRQKKNKRTDFRPGNQNPFPGPKNQVPGRQPGTPRPGNKIPGSANEKTSKGNREKGRDNFKTKTTPGGRNQ